MFKNKEYDNHEHVSYFNLVNGFKAIIAIHSTILGPSLGGIRMYPYKKEEDALSDVLRLSKGMTYKSCLAELDLGGGKAVILGNPKNKTPELFFSLGEAINRLGGRYIAAEDSGTSVDDIEYVHRISPHVAGTKDGSGDPSKATAQGVYNGIRAAIKFQHNLDSVAFVDVFVEGIGNVGLNLCKLLYANGARIHICDKNPLAIETFTRDKNEPVNVYTSYEEFIETRSQSGTRFHIYAPCAMGQTINEKLLLGMQEGDIIAGCANNQLSSPEMAQILLQRNILYAPDYVINAGGIINVYSEYNTNFTRADVGKKINNIFYTLMDIFERSKKENKPTSTVANEIVGSRFERIKSRTEPSLKVD